MLTRLLSLLLIFLTTLFLAACSNTKSSYDFDSSFDFTRIMTYQWDKTPSVSFASAHPLIDQRIINAIDAALNKKNLDQSLPADVKISYSVSFKEKLGRSGINTGIGLSIGKSSRGHIRLNSASQLKQTTEGTLIIDITSAKNGALLWRGTCIQAVSKKPSSPEKSQVQIREAVNELLKNLPPSGKK